MARPTYIDTKHIETWTVELATLYRTVPAMSPAPQEQAVVVMPVDACIKALVQKRLLPTT